MELNKKRDRLGWRLPFFTAIFTALANLPFVFLGSFDFFWMLCIFVVVPIVSLGFALAILIISIRRKETPRLAVFLMLPVFWAVTFLFFKYSYELRTTCRWAFAADQYKNRVQAQPTAKSGEFKHIEWDGWGFAGQDTVVYLVYDPDNSLLGPARSKSPGKFTGVPCAVSGVHRLEDHWYLALFYTDTDWEHCSYN